MKSRIIIFSSLTLIVIILAVYGYFRAVPNAENGTESLPKIEIVPTFFDFGLVEYGAVAKHTFKVKNSGTKILEIIKVATSCGCTQAKIAKTSIEPGEEADLNVEYNTGLMSGSHAQGAQERIIYVKSNDPVKPQVEAIIMAIVK